MQTIAAPHGRCAPYTAKQGGVFLLMGEGSTAAEDLLRARRPQFCSGTVLGGIASVSDSLVDRLGDAVA